MINQIEIKPLLKTDINNILHLQPEGWNDIRKVFLQFMGYDFFYPVKAIFQGKIIGVGEAIFNKKSAWVGVIVVDKPFRNKGIGTFISEHLLKYIASKNINTKMLLATPIGESVYAKLGFRKISEYVFLKKEKAATGQKSKEKKPVNQSTQSTESWVLENKKVIRFKPKYFDQIAYLDKLAMGEDRSEILKEFTRDALLFVENELKGFYLPNLGDGLIIAKNHEAGFALLKIKWATDSELIILPKENTEIIEFAENQGFTAFRYAARMIIGDSFDWNPQMIYNRVGGYLG